MFLTYPEGHKHEGLMVGRRAVCACGTEYRQGKLNPDWLAEMSTPERREKFLEACQTDADGAVWLSKMCPHCERRGLRSTPRNPKQERLAL